MNLERMFTKNWLTNSISNEQFVQFFFLTDHSHLCQQVKKTLRDVLLEMGTDYFAASKKEVKEACEKSIALMCLKYRRNELSYDGSLFEVLFKQFNSVLKQLKLNERQKHKQQKVMNEALIDFVRNYPTL